MTDRELRNLPRAKMLGILFEQETEIERLNAEVRNLEEQLKVYRTGGIAAAGGITATGGIATAGGTTVDANDTEAAAAGFVPAEYASAEFAPAGAENSNAAIIEADVRKSIARLVNEARMSTAAIETEARKRAQDIVGDAERIRSEAKKAADTVIMEMSKMLDFYEDHLADLRYEFSNKTQGISINRIVTDTICDQAM